MSQTRPLAVAAIPSDQRFTWRVTPLPGRLLDAAAIGLTIEKVCTILCTKDRSGADVFPALLGVRLTDDGAFEADIAILPVDPPSRLRRPAPSPDGND